MNKIVCDIIAFLTKLKETLRQLSFRNLKPGHAEKLVLFNEFELCNPLGSKQGKHRVLAGYLATLISSPKFHSKLNKYLALLVKCSLLRKFELHKSFQ